MIARQICEICGRSGSGEEINCLYCGTKYLSAEESLALLNTSVIGAPMWGRICVSFRDEAPHSETHEALGNQWKQQEEAPTQQRLFPFQAEKFAAPVNNVILYAPLVSYHSLVKYVDAYLPGKVDISFTEMDYEEIYAAQDAWLVQRGAVSAQEVYAYHKATGCPIARAKQVIAAMNPELRMRVIRAVREQYSRSRSLHDPIEDDPAFADIVRDASKAAEQTILEKGPLRRGSCHAIWKEQARILLEQHNIVWFSPRQMNPDVSFD